MRQRRSGLAALIVRIGLLIALTLAVHFTYALWPWPEAPRGAKPLREAVLAERARLEAIAPESAIELVDFTLEWTYRVAFEWTGLDYLVRLATEEIPQGGFDEMVRLVATGLWLFLETLYWSVQLIGLRLGVLLGALPLFLVVALGAATDGAAAWYLRRSSVGRESSFLYHRAKLSLWSTLFALWAVYLLPPVPLSPEVVLPPFVLIFGLTARVAVSWFKKHL